MIRSRQPYGCIRLHTHYQSQFTGASYTEARGEGFLKLVRDSVRLCGRRTLLEQFGDATKLTTLRRAASCPVTKEAQGEPHRTHRAAARLLTWLHAFIVISCL